MPKKTKIRQPGDIGSRGKNLGAAAKWVMPPASQVVSKSKDELVSLFPLELPDDDEVMGTFFAMHSGMIEDDRPHILKREAEHGDKQALERIVKIAEEFTFHLNDLAKKRPELLHSLARSRSVWPILSNASNAVRKANLALFSELELGTTMDFGKEIQALGLVTTPKKRWACLLLSLISTIRGVAKEWPNMGEVDVESSYYDFISDSWTQHLWRLLAERFSTSPFEKIVISRGLLAQVQQLEPFWAKGAAKEWWRAGKDVLMLCTDGHPEKLPELKEIGRCRSKHDSVMTDASRDPAVRAKIFTDLHEEFDRFANQIRKAIGIGASK